MNRMFMVSSVALLAVSLANSLAIAGVKPAKKGVEGAASGGFCEALRSLVSLADKFEGFRSIRGEENPSAYTEAPSWASSFVVPRMEKCTVDTMQEGLEFESYQVGCEPTDNGDDNDDIYASLVKSVDSCLTSPSWTRNQEADSTTWERKSRATQDKGSYVYVLRDPDATLIVLEKRPDGKEAKLDRSQWAHFKSLKEKKMKENEASESYP